MIINLSKIDFGGIATGGGKTKPEEQFDVHPTTSDQTITPTEGSVFSGGTVRAVTKEIDGNIVAGNIKEGVTILGVAGSLKEEKPEESFNVQPTTAEQTITPTTGSVFSGGTVHAVTSSIDSNIVPGNIKEGVSILGVAGTLSEGGGSDVFVVPNGVKFSLSTFTEIPSNWDFSSITDASQMFNQCTGLTTITNLNTSNVTNATQMFLKCSALRNISLLDTSSVTDATYMFQQCSNLTTIPLLNTSNITNATGMFCECHNLATISQLDFSNVTNALQMFYDCNALTTIPEFNFSSVTNASQMFNRCTGLTTIPELNFSNVTDASYIFYSCQSLTNIPQLDFSSVTNAINMFGGCIGLTTIPQLNISKATDISWMFYACENLTTIPQLNTSNASIMEHMFYSCPNLTTVEGIDFSGLTSNLNNLFGYDSDKSKLTRFIVNGKINVSISDDYSIKALTAIDYDSVKSILAAADRTDNTNAKELAFNRTMTDQNGELAALVASCTSKGWTITGLTIQ